MVMKKMLPILFFMTVVYLIALQPASAETVVLKSGKSIEAKITDRTKQYIKVDIEGVPITYYFADIESINGKRITSQALTEEISQEDKIAPQTQEKSPLLISPEWKEWSLSINDYAMQLALINMKVQRFQMDMQSSRMQNSNQGNTLDGRARQLSAQVSEILNELNRITPPPELEGYHKKFIESVQFIKSSSEALAKGDNSTFIANLRQSITASIEAVREMRQLYVKHKAPQQYVEEMDMAIEQMNAVLSKINQIKL